MKAVRIAILGTAVLLGACATTANIAGPVDVTRFHLGQPPERTTVSIEPLSSNQTISPEYRLYADAVVGQLERQGYVRSTSDMASGYIAGVSFLRTSRGFVRKRSPVSIGIGAGSFGGNVGVGGGASFPIGGGGEAEVIATELKVQLRRRSDDTVVWEGRAVTEGAGEGADSAATAERLAAAMFRDFPGESGITITVK